MLLPVALQQFAEYGVRVELAGEQAGVVLDYSKEEAGGLQFPILDPVEHLEHLLIEPRAPVSV